MYFEPTRFPSRLIPVTALGILLVTAALGGCSRPQAAESGGKQAPPPLPVTTMTAHVQNVPISLEAVGQTEGAKQVEVHARVSGILEKRLYMEGAAVKAGEPLFQIEREPYEIALASAKAQLAEEKARAEQANREEKRLKGLLAQKAVSQRDYDNAVSTASLERASLQAAEARIRQAELDLNYTLVKAPVSGVSGRAAQSDGNLLTAGQNSSLLTTIDQIEPIWVRFSIAPADLAGLRAAHPAWKGIDVQLVLADGSTYPEKGHINFTASAVDTSLGTVQLRAEFPNAQHELLPGQFVRVKLSTDPGERAILVPQSAVMQGEQGRFVYVLGKDGKATVRPVQADRWSGKNWVVTHGLSDGDQVIVDNLLKIRPGAPVIVAPEGGAADKKF